jgi:Ti-type conjugative transfer relaxase TraA
VAICYLNNKVISADRTYSVMSTVAYAGRCRMECPVTGKVFDHSDRAGDVLFRAVLLPEGAPDRLKDPPRGDHAAEADQPEVLREKTQRMSQALWQESDESNRITERKTKIRRFRKHAQLGYRMIVAAPEERPIDEISELVCDFVQKEFVRHGVPAEVTIHRADDEAGRNIHVHIIIATRVLGPDGFGLKARHLLPDFVGRKGKSGRIRTGHDWPRRWAAFQNHWYQRRGIDLQVDPIAAQPGIHIGKWRDPEREAERRARNEAKQIESAEIARDPVRLLRVIEDQLPVFGLPEIMRHLRRNGVMGFEARQIAHRLLALPEIVALEPRMRHPVTRGKGKPTETRLYTTKAILAQEKRIHDRVEYLYGEMVWNQPLPAGMAPYAEQLIRTRQLDAEQAEAVRHAFEGPGVRVNQGVAGAGKSYLLATVRMVYEQFKFKVIAMAPTNLVAADLRTNGFDASTIHRFIQEVRRGQRTIAPNTVLIVDEAGMVGAGLYDELTEIAVAHKCRLILTGDDRQLPPIGRGGIYGKIRHMVGDARLSKVRRQNEDWMKAASESLSTWDIAAGIEAYASRGAIAWTPKIEDAAMALVQTCIRDLDADPGRDLSQFAVYCARNDSVDIMNDAIQFAIWRNAPAEGTHEFACCRGKVRVRAGDRIQFYETDPKKGLFNGALGSICGLSGQGIHVRLDSGDDVVFDPNEFTGWGLGYAGTVHRGQGQTKHRSYLLYDDPFVWNAALTYVALTRHKETTNLFVPRELAPDRDALVEQMSRTVDQPLASDYAVIDPKEAAADAADALYPLQPPVAWTIAGAKNQDLDLNRERDAEEARSAFRRMKAPEFAIAYRSLCTKASGKPIAHPYQMLKSSAEITAMTRGFKPGSGKFDPLCLKGVFNDKEREDHVEHPLLGRQDGEMDVAPAVIHPNFVDISFWRRLAKRLQELDGFVRNALSARLVALRRRARPDTTISAALGAAQFLVRLCGRGNAVPTAQDIAAAKATVGAPREVFDALKFWRAVGPDEHDEVPLPDAIQYAFTGRMPPAPPRPAPTIQQRPSPSLPVTGMSPSTAVPPNPAPVAKPASNNGPRLP